MRKPTSESRALVKLRRIKDEYRNSISEGYEHKAKSCLSCETPGACCVDAHFVNVQITRLEAVAIQNVLENLPKSRRTLIQERIEETIKRFGLSTEGDTFKKTYACPLFEPGIGCLVHEEAKPLPCIQHACYEVPNDLPPASLLDERQKIVSRLNESTYLEVNWRSIPMWLQTLSSE